jgi:hypothetical protein
MGFWMMTIPPAALTWRAPSDPSDPEPVRMTAMRFSPKIVAALDSSMSTEGRGPLSPGGRSVTWWSVIST